MLDPNEEKPYLGENPGIGYCFFEDTDTRIEFNVRDINRYEEYGYLTIMAFEQLSAELDNIDIGLDKNAILTSLIGGLADILDHQIMVSISRDGLNSLKITNEVVTQNFIQAANQALQRIQKDFHTVIKNGFLSELDADSVRLTSISAGGGDFHKKNKQVMMLSFQDAAGNKKKVVYKPSSVMADAMIVGDVERLKTLTGDYKFQYSLLELLNMGSEGDNALPKYLIVPRSDDDPLEHLKSNRDIKINTDKDYGYVEFLPHNPWEEPDCVDMLNKLAREKGRKPTNEELQYEVNKFYSKLLRKAAENENCDYFTQDKDAEKNYSKACGRLLAILWVCGGIDMHCQNLIMSGKMPHLIDLEVCLSKLVHDLANTVSGDKSGALQGGSLDTIEVDYLYNDKLCEYTVQHPGKNILFSVEKQGDIDVIDNCSSDPKQVKKGFKEGLKIFKSNQKLLNSWFSFPSVQNMMIRVPMRPTGKLHEDMKWLRKSDFSQEEHEAIRRPYIQENFEYYKQSNDEFNRNDFIIYINDENDTDILSEYRSLNIPSYYTYANHMNIYNSNGDVIYMPTKDADVQHLLDNELQVDEKLCYFPITPVERRRQDVFVLLNDPEELENLTEQAKDYFEQEKAKIEKQQFNEGWQIDYIVESDQEKTNDSSYSYKKSR